MSALTLDLAGDVAVITGAGKGIGANIASVLSQAGARVAIFDVDPVAAQAMADQITRSGGAATSVVVDVADGDSVRAGMQAVFDAFGRIDILVNNAGIYPFGQLEEVSDAVWDRVMAINLKGPLSCIRSALPHMRPGGRIVNISSVGSLRVTVGQTSAYEASKAGLNALTRSAADELGPRGIRVNAVAPGGVTTEGTAATPEEVLKAWIARTPARRMGLPQDIAAAVLFLVSPLADYVHGHLLVVDGGFMVR
jgi:NAD(P)-dependent dehydrogenase (short-subunit alcohol dehydrogenase family)